MTPTKVGHVQSFHSRCESCKITSVSMSKPRRRIVNRHIVRNPTTMFCFTKQNLRPTCSATANVPIQKSHEHFLCWPIIRTQPQSIVLQNPQKTGFFLCFCKSKRRLEYINQERDKEGRRLVIRNPCRPNLVSLDPCRHDKSVKSFNHGVIHRLWSPGTQSSVVHHARGKQEFLLHTMAQFGV